MFQPGGDLGRSAGNLRKHTFRRFQGLEILEHSPAQRVFSLFQCSSSGSDWAASKDGGAGRGNLRARKRTVARSRSAPPDQIRLVGGPSAAGGSTSQHRSRSRPTKLWLNTHLPTVTFLAHWNIRLFHGTLVPTRVFQTKSSRSGLKLTTHTFQRDWRWSQNLGTLEHSHSQSSSGPAGPSSPPRCHEGVWRRCLRRHLFLTC